MTRSWDIQKIDNNAFLNGDLQEEVYMHQLASFVNQENPRVVCKLRKALYGLKQVPRAWFDLLKYALTELGFHNFKSNTSLFVYKSGDIIIYCYLCM